MIQRGTPCIGEQGNRPILGDLLIDLNTQFQQSISADDGASYGVLVKLNAGAATRLTSITADNRGQYLLAIVNGQVRDAVLIDRAVDDGVLVIWQRISIAEVRQADAAMPRIGQDTKEWKKNLKKKK